MSEKIPFEFLLPPYNYAWRERSKGPTEPGNFWSGVEDNWWWYFFNRNRRVNGGTE